MAPRPRSRRDRNLPYLAVLVERSPTGHTGIHAGLARHGHGHPFCDDKATLFEFPLTAQDPRFSLQESDGWRHRYAEATLELNRGCQACLHTLYEIGREAGWHKPKGLAA